MFPVPSWPDSFRPQHSTPPVVVSAQLNESPAASQLAPAPSPADLATGSTHLATGSPNLLLSDFLQERWKGLTPILWGAQLKQARLDELIYLSLMNADHLPDGERASPLTEFYHFELADDKMTVGQDEEMTK